ncbi:HlyD family efflux transporter periplasmic adaptor subunit [Carboxylicivirga mesophila]|uniref:HlyD family efflux transporter periplasmic adaptor subunit n=1 Tax=Carboxylicivirga mesophila TaxID=1166478 RepID=A0ABS5K458_9BACT|nr:HlyD family efflux transporter periplasmic adaptor subunit [Carboxylicivirga mesophila]MBS2209816.1 HlyD family efflux transporter periplasmic adaptor subunit [Carboxylicivirga mesophila]
MKQIFPPEIAVHSTEAHFQKHSQQFVWIYVFSLILIIISIIVLPFIHVELTTQGRGVIRTPVENSQIQSSFAGQIIKCELNEGEQVFVGDTLVVLRADDILEQVELAREQLDEKKRFVDDLSLLLKGINKPKTNRYCLEATQYQARLNELSIKGNILKKEYEIAKSLYHDNVTPEMEYLQKKSNYDAAVSQLEVYQRQSLNNWQVEKTKLLQECTSLSSSINRLKKECEQYIITAPIAGTISAPAGVQVGSFITPGQALATISPNEHLIAECYIHPKDIGFIKQGQEVRLQLDAYNYNQWGLLIGEVSAVADDIVVINNQPVFKVRATIPANYLELKSGHKGHLMKGMTLTGRFVLTNRTLYQLLFDKVDDWMNPKLVKSE